MAELIANWLNEEVGLSKRVTNFEEDFASGYLFGELLYKFNQQPDFEEFSTKNATSHFVMNFERLEPTLRALKIQFNSKTVEQVMRGERGLALRLLYQIKMVLEKVYPPADISIVAKTGKFGDNLPAQKIVASKPKYDDVTHEFFKQRLAKLNRAQKEIDLENHLEGFEVEKDRQASHAARLDGEDRDADVLRKQEMRRIQINKLQRNAGFMEEWMQKGAEQWKSNMVKKREREQAQLDFDLSQAEKFNRQAENKLDDANIEVHEGIEKFEAALREKGISTKVDKEVAAAAVTATLTEGVTWAPSTTMHNGNASATKKGSFNTGTIMQNMATTKKGNYTLTSTGLKSRAKKTLTEDEQKQRIKRRRRLITHQEHLFTNLHAQTRETIVFEQMKRQSRQEKELDYEAWRTTQCKSIIQENRKLREQQYGRRRELDSETAVIKEERLIEEMCEGSKRSVCEMVKRTGELKGYEQELKKKQRTELCSMLMDKIFDISDEAFNHKQKLDASECDQRNWDNWITLFVEDKPIAGTLSSISTAVSKEEPAEDAEEDELVKAAKKDAEELEQATQCTDQANEQLNETELENYLRNKGEWPASLVSEKKLNLMDVLNPPQDAAGAAGGKGAPKKAAAPTETVMDEADLTLTDEAENNFLLGDVIDQLIKLNFDERNKTKHPQTPNWLNLKLSLVGYPFSGTHTQSNYIKERFGLDVFNMEVLVQEAIDCPDEPVEPEIVSEVCAEQEAEAAMSEKKSEIAVHADDKSAKGSVREGNSPMAKSVHKSQTDLVSCQDEAVVEAPKEPSVCDMLSEDEDMVPNCREELRLCGCLIRETLLDGLEIPDELYVRLFVNKLRATYDYKTPQQKMDEMKGEAQEICDINQRICEIDREMLGDLKEKQRIKKADERSRLMQRHESMQKLNNNGWVIIDFPNNYAQSKLLEEALSGYKPAEELEPTMRESETQSAGLLVKPNPKPEPPKTLIPSGLDLVLWFDCPIAECLRRADGRRFDADTPDMCYHVEDKVPPSTHAPLCERLLPLSEDNNCVNTLADRFVAFDQTTSSMKKWFKQFGDEGQCRVLLQQVKASQSKAEVSSDIEKAIQYVLDQKAVKKNALREMIQAKFDVQRLHLEEIRLTKTPEALDPSAATAEQQETVGSIENNDKKSQNASQNAPAKIAVSQDKVTGSVDTVGSTRGAEAGKIVFERDNIDMDFRPVLIKMWQQMSVNYRQQMKIIFQSVRVHRERYFNIQSDLQTRFLCYLQRLDNKQECLDEFVDKFNAFTDEYPDLREDEQTKEELHQRTDVLSDELWEVVEERKESNTEERRKIMEAGEIEFGLEFLTLSAQQLMQAELDKFKVSVQIIHDYYHAVEEKNTPEVPGIPSCELTFEGEDMPSVEFVGETSDRSNIESYSYPRLEKLLAMALRMQVIPDVTHQAAAGAGADKKGKAPAKGKAPTATEDTITVEDSVYVREMKEALRVEKSILRFRLVQIRNWSYQRLHELRNSAIRLYKKLEDWIQVAQKTEMDAIEEMCVVIKRAIEGEAKIQNELKIKFMDFTVDQKTLNFITPAPPKLDALEEFRSERFAIPQLQCILQELQLIADSTGSSDMQVVELASLLFSKVKLSAAFNGFDSGMPEMWNKLALQDMVGIVRMLDPKNVGFVNWKTLFTYMALEQSSVPQKVDTSAVKQENGFAEKADFMAHKWWFSATETSKDRVYSHTFERVNMLTGLLFEANKTTVEGGREVICLSEWERRVTQGFKNNRVFHDLLFGGQKH